MTERTEGNSHAPTPAPTSPVAAGEHRTRPLILGHRGSPLEAPENTLRAYDLALRAGADGVEMDVRPSRDGVAVVAHDDLLQRAPRLRRKISGLDWPAIERLTGGQLPSFEQVTAWAAATSAWLNVEIKEPGVEEEVVRRIRETGIAERVIVSSFNETITHRIGELDPELVRYFLTKKWNAPARRRFGAADASGVCLRVDAATPAALADLRSVGLPVIAWTVNDRIRVRELLAEGVFAIISDDPAMVVAERRAFVAA